MATGKSQLVWDSMTRYGLDKVAHLGFSGFGASATMKGRESFPEYAMSLTEEREDLLSRNVYRAGEKLSDPSFQQKAGLAILAVATLGTGKEAWDMWRGTYMDPLDMTANMAGTGLAILREYGDGDLKKGT